MSEQKTVITLICERAAEVNDLLDSSDQINGMPNVKVVKFPCSGMIQPLMVEAAIKSGASGVVVCGCQIGDCYYREGNKMIRDRLLGSRPPTLKKFVDKRRVLALWLSRLQKTRFMDETKEFSEFVAKLDREEGAKPAPPKPAAKPAPAKPAPAPAPAAASENAAAPAEKKVEPQSDGGAKIDLSASAEKAEAKPSLAQLKDVNRGAASAESKEEAKPEPESKPEPKPEPEPKTEAKAEPDSAAGA